MIVEIDGIQYLVIEQKSIQSLRERYAGIAERMEAYGIEKQLCITNPKYPITYDPRGQSSNIYIAYLKDNRAFWDLPQ
jgi:hypothetical protein